MSVGDVNYREMFFMEDAEDFACNIKEKVSASVWITESGDFFS